MKFFVSWTKREPEFQKLDPQCNILVSPTNLPNDWNVSNWEILPKRLIVDSGAYSYRDGNIPDCDRVFKRQRDISKSWPRYKRLYFSHPDVIIPLKSTFKESNSIITTSIERAKVYFGLHAKLKSKSIPIGVIHGFDEETIVSTYYELRNIGYNHFALGSIGIRLGNYKQMCLQAIEVAKQYDITPLHLFGITLPLNDNNYSNAVESFDTSTPVKLAFYGTVLYGHPLKRYVISPNAIQRHRDKSFSFRESIPHPLPCNCPVCIDDPRKLLESGTIGKMKRIIHNYFQIKWETETIN